ncbi:MAG: hypothetical protein ACK4UN_04820 [Limisphaerales bacterium]
MTLPLLSWQLLGERTTSSASVENFFAVTTNIYSGATPESDVAFLALKEKGVKTIISVDGARPDAETAAKFGMRYVHLPIGYDGISTNRQLELIKAAQDLPGPIFVHCHHGKHRGPAAAAIMCMGTEDWKATRGVAWLRQAGTATNYSGLYAVVEKFQKPGAEELAAVSSEFPEHATVSSTVEAMVGMDEHITNLKAIRTTGYKKSPTHPDIVPAHEALLLHELFKEMLRAPDASTHCEGFLVELNAGEQASAAFHALLSTEKFSIEEAEKAFQKITQNCTACHRKFRD